MLRRFRKLTRLLVAVGTGLARLISGKGGRSRGGRGPLIEITVFRCDMLSPAAAVTGGRRR